MASRLNLQKDLETILGSRNVYFQPPESVKIKYPCIVYDETRGQAFHANDYMYVHRRAYDVTVIDKNPDSEIPDKIRYSFARCDAGGPYKADNLNHWKFTIYI